MSKQFFVDITVRERNHDGTKGSEVVRQKLIDENHYGINYHETIDQMIDTLKKSHENI